MTNGELERHLIQSILPVYGEREARAIQRFLFHAFHGQSDAGWLLMRSKSAKPEFESAVIQSIPLLQQQVPVQYVAGKTWFCDLEFIVKPGVLIPRPETEALVMMIAERFSTFKGLRILDIGTGSGVIAVSLSALLQNPGVAAFDISDAALETAKANSAKHHQKVRFFNIDILDQKAWPENDTYNLIVSNPPYVKESEKAVMQPNVLNFEPALALFVEDADPLKFYRAISGFSMRNLTPGGSLWLEINETEGRNIRHLLDQTGFRQVDIINDLAGKPRYAAAVK